MVPNSEEMRWTNKVCIEKLTGWQGSHLSCVKRDDFDTYVFVISLYEDEKIYVSPWAININNLHVLNGLNISRISLRRKTETFTPVENDDYGNHHLLTCIDIFDDESYLLRFSKFKQNQSCDDVVISFAENGMSYNSSSQNGAFFDHNDDGYYVIKGLIDVIVEAHKETLESGNLILNKY